MLEGERPELDRFYVFSSVFPCAAAKDIVVKNRVSHKAVAAVNSAGCFSCNIQTRDIALASFVDLDSSILVVEGRVDEHRFFGDVDSTTDKLAVHVEIDNRIALAYY